MRVAFARGIDERCDVFGNVGSGIDGDPGAVAAVDDVPVGTIVRHQRGVRRAQARHALGESYHVFSNCGGKRNVGPGRTSGVIGIVFLVSAKVSSS